MLARRFLPCLLGISLCMRAAGELGKPGRARGLASRAGRTRAGTWEILALPGLICNRI